MRAQRICQWMMKVKYKASFFVGRLYRFFISTLISQEHLFSENHCCRTIKYCKNAILQNSKNVLSSWHVAMRVQLTKQSSLAVDRATDNFQVFLKCIEMLLKQNYVLIQNFILNSFMNTNSHLALYQVSLWQDILVKNH